MKEACAAYRFGQERYEVISSRFLQVTNRAEYHKLDSEFGYVLKVAYDNRTGTLLVANFRSGNLLLVSLGKQLLVDYNWHEVSIRILASALFHPVSN